MVTTKFYTCHAKKRPWHMQNFAMTESVQWEHSNNSNKSKATTVTTFVLRALIWRCQRYNILFNVCAVWEGWLTDEMLFSIFVWNETFLSVVLALYYLLKFPSLYQNLKKNSFYNSISSWKKLLPLYLKCVYSSFTLKPYQGIFW